MKSALLALISVLVATLLLGAPHCRAQAPIDVNVLRGEPSGGIATAAESKPPAAAPVATPAPKAVAASSTNDDDSETSQGARLDPPDPQDKARLDQSLKSLETAGLSADDKQKAAAFYKQAIEAFDLASQQRATALQFQDEIAKLPTVLEDYKIRLANPLPPIADASGETLEQVLERTKKAEDSVAHCKERLNWAKTEPKRRSQRLAEIPGLAAEAQLKLKQATEELAAMAPEDPSRFVDAAHRALLVQAKSAQRWTLAALDAEQRLYQQGSELFQVLQDYYVRYIPHKERRLAQLRDFINRLNKRSEEEAQKQAQQAAAKAAEAAVVVAPKFIAELANENKDLAEKRARVRAEITLVTKQKDESTSELTALKAEFEKSQKQCELDQHSSFSGRILRDQQSTLPNLWSLRRQSMRHEAERSEVLIRIYDLNDKRSALSNIDELAKEIAARAANLSDGDLAQIRELLTTKKDTLQALIDDLDAFSSNLADLHTNELQLIALTQQYSDFIAERILWIRSCRMLSRRELRPAAGAIAWSLDPLHWRDAGRTIVDSATRQPVPFVLFGLAFVAMCSGQRAARNRLRRYGAEAEKRSCIQLRPTIHALGLTVFLALPWPALLAFLGWSLDSYSESEFVRSLSISLGFTGLCLLLLELTRHLCRRGGLADAHFDWQDAYLVHLRRRLRWFTVIGLPLVLWLVGLEVQTQEPLWSASWGRICFIALMLLMAVKLQRLLMARVSPYRQLMLVRGKSWLTLIQIVWRPAIVALPAALAVLAAVGYYYTAQQAAVRILQTAGMLLTVLALGGLTRRWLLVNRRRLAREQAKQRRAQLAAAAADADGTMTIPSDLSDDAIDLAAVSEQTQRLVRTILWLTTSVGLVLIWTAILPALAYGASNTLPFAKTLTWADLLVCGLILAVTYVSVRGVPALLELVVLQHLPLDGGSRYAITSVSRYVLTSVGLVAAFNSMGCKWAEVQWLVAAMSVGLGFGLQEIFANFVSGIILLFERPIRVGDVVTLGDKTGVVNRIRMRATTIVDWDRKEYVVPNKDLVTERLLNWTLSDQMNRIEVAMAVAHGSDTDKACALLLEAAREQPHVLSEPAASAAFEGFTEQGPKLVLRCFLPTLEHRGTTTHQLYTAIDRKFRAAGIEIPSPPREMRVRLMRDAAHMAFGSHNTAKPGKQNAA